MSMNRKQVVFLAGNRKRDLYGPLLQLLHMISEGTDFRLKV